MIQNNMRAEDKPEMLWDWDGDLKIMSLENEHKKKKKKSLMNNNLIYPHQVWPQM